MKDLPFFKFDTSEWISGDINFHCYLTKGVFIDICAFYWHKNCCLTINWLHRRYGGDISILTELIKEELIKENKDGTISISFLDEQYTELVANKELLSEYGKKGAKKRWGGDGVAIAKLKGGNGKVDIDIEEEEDIKKTKKKGFRPPLFNELSSFIKDNEYNVEPQGFLDYYNSNGWKVGRNSMKDWQACVRNWHRKNPIKQQSHTVKNIPTPQHILDLVKKVGNC